MSSGSVSSVLVVVCNICIVLSFCEVSCEVSCEYGGMHCYEVYVLVWPI